MAEIGSRNPPAPSPELYADLLESERRYRHLVEQSGAYICLHDLTGLLLSVNRAAAESLGYDASDMTGRNLREFIDPRHVADFDAYLEQVAQNTLVSGVMNVRRRDGELRAWTYHNSLYREPGKAPVVFGHAQDITDMKRLEDTLKLTQFSVDRAADAVFWIAPDGQLRYVNDAACEALGYSRDELLARSIHDIDITLDESEWPAHWEQTRSLERFTTETLYEARTGRRVPVEVTVNFLHFRGQEYQCVFARDITERKEAEDAIIATTARLEGLIENLPVGILFENDARRVVLANQTLCQMLDIPVPPSSLAGADSRTLLEQCKDLFPEPPAFLQRVEEILTTQTLVKNEELPLGDGQVYARDYIPIVNQNYRAHLWQFRDVTERKRAEAEILQAKIEAEKANAAKSSFLAMMSHELRTPLNAILGMTELMQESELSRDQREFMRTIHTNSENLLRLIDDVLDLSKIEANRMDIDRIAFDPRGLVEEVAESLNVRAAAKGVDIVVDIDPHLPAEILGDPKRIRQVLVNLVGNAVKFTEKGYVHIAVEVADWKPGDRVDLAYVVTDSGVGIPKDKQEKLFSRFYQADRSTTRRFGGTGLGLNISRSLVELMGGRIDFVSEEGLGSTFRMSLSTTVPENIEPNSARHRLQLAERTAKAFLLVSLEKQRRSLALLLKAWGLQVELAESLEELEAKLPSSTAEAVVSIVEHRPERMDLEALRRLRRPPRREVVLLTSLGVSTSTVLTEICPYLLLKPVRQERLAAALVRALGLRPGEAAPPVTAPEPAAAPLARHRILLVEDNPDNQKLAARVLEGAGARVDTAENGEEAVRRASRILYDLVVMDVMMPVMDGFQATRAIRRRETPPNRVPVVALTAHATEGFRDRCLECGMDDYLSKPFKRERFLALVDQWVDRRPIVLVADDAAESRLIVKRFLMLGGDYRLLFAANGQEALELFERQDVSLVLIDVEMPVMNGLEAVKRLRSSSSRDPRVPVLAMTAHTDSGELKRCLAAGASAVLQKPLERKSLGIAVAKHLRPRMPRGFRLPETEEADTANEAAGLVQVDPDILDLVPRFLENQKAAASRVVELARSGDFEAVRRIGHNMKGTGKGYGFDVVSSCGASLEQAAVRAAGEDIERIARELTTYLGEVRWQPRG